MTAAELVVLCRAGGHWQLHVNQFVDDFRRCTPADRAATSVEPPSKFDRYAGLVAAIVSSLSREVGQPVPVWVQETGSPEPFFAFPARGFALRLRLMVESPPAFRIRNVFVPSDYLSRA